MFVTLVLMFSFFTGYFIWFLANAAKAQQRADILYRETNSLTTSKA